MKKIVFILMTMLIFVHAAAAQPSVDYMHINAEVSNGYSITTVEEKLTNQLDAPVNDDFKFLIPEEAFISGFSLIINGKEYVANVLPKKEAQEKFEQASSQGRSAGLLESKNKNMFSYSLSFEPGQSIIVKLKYEQAVKKSLGKFEYVLFLRNTDNKINVNDLSVVLNITSINDITTLETPGFSGANVKYSSTTSGRVTYNANALPDKDLTVVYTTNNPLIDGDMLFYNLKGQGYMMHVFSPNETELGTTALSKDIIFVVDKSGSMTGDKIAQVKTVFTKIISDLPPDDYFNIIFFDTTIRTFSNTLMEADTKNKADSANFVNGLDSNGGTNINQALLDSLGMFDVSSKRVPIIVFLTDGAPTEGITSPYVIRKNIKEANKAQVSIFTIAFGIADEANYDFLKALSFENYGKAQRFFLEGKVEEEMTDFYRTISTPLITDMNFNYNSVSDVVNTGQFNLFAGSDAIVLGKYSGSAVTSDIAATTRSGSRNFKKSFNVISKPENSFIPRLWAYTRIKNMMDRIDVEGETDALVSSITSISLEFKFVTPYTSLFVEVPGNTKTTSTAIDAKTQAVTEAVAPATTGTPYATYATVAATYAKPAETVSSYSTPAVDSGRNKNYAPSGGHGGPGFEIIFAIIGLFIIKYLIVRKGR
ncbi:MAG: VIT domain-containing protein [Candidatus Methanoperedens sp.]|nr:VIT domain-containing protein [Candidatus Methanoperedens sp.]